MTEDKPDTAGAKAKPLSCPIRRGRPARYSRCEREMLIQEAMERVIAEKGLRGATMEAIAGEAGMSKRTLYAVYDSRDALFEAWVRRLRASVIRPLSPEERALPLPERLRRLLSSETRCGDSERRLLVLRAVIAEAAAYPQMARAYLREGPDAARDILRAELDHAVAAGELRPLNACKAAHLLLDMVYATKLRRLLDPDGAPPTPAEAEERLSLALTVFLDGALLRQESSSEESSSED